MAIQSYIDDDRMIEICDRDAIDTPGETRSLESMIDDE
jgi:hypothetical protein